MKRSELIFNALLVPVDFLMILLAGFLAYQFRFSNQISSLLRPIVFELDFSSFWEIVIMTTPIFILFLIVFGLYSLTSVRKFWQQVLRISGAVSAAFMFIIVFIFFAQQTFPSRFIFVATWLLMIFMISFGRGVMRYIQGFLIHKYNFGFHRLVLVGGNGTVKSIQNEIRKNRTLGYKIIRKLRDLDLDLLEKIYKDPGIDEIILCSSDMEKEKVQKLLDFCQERNLGFKFVPDMFQSQAALFEMETISDVTLIEVKRTPLDGWGKVLKRFTDIVVSSIGIILLTPFFVLVAFLIKLETAGPVFVKLKRVGKYRNFDLYKFRSMVRNAHEMKYNTDGTLREEFKKNNERGEGPLFKLRNDPRITRLGRILRMTRIDEFPQLFNVLKGEMSLVGPRPHEPEEVAKYKKHHRKLFAIKPGITGMAQVSGSSDLNFEKEVKLDVYYIENWSMALDFIILIKTFLIFIKGDNSAC